MMTIGRKLLILAAIAAVQVLPRATACPITTICRETYVTMLGDTCDSIAKKFEITVEQLTCANSFIDCDSLWFGTPLCIPKINDVFARSWVVEDKLKGSKPEPRDFGLPGGQKARVSKLESGPPGIVPPVLPGGQKVANVVAVPVALVPY